MKRFCTILLAMLVVCGLSGCISSGTYNESVDEQSASESLDEVGVVTQENISNTVDSLFYPIGDDKYKQVDINNVTSLTEMYNGEKTGQYEPNCIFIGRDIDNTQNASSSDFVNRSFLSGYQNSEYKVTTYDRSAGSQLLTTDPDVIICKPELMMYWSGNLFSYDGYYQEIEGTEADGRDNGKYPAEEGYFSNSLLEQLLAKKGITIETFFDVHSGGGMDKQTVRSRVEIWSSAQPTSLNVARYEGTQWQEGVIQFATPYWVIDTNAKLPVEKTKEGYFYVDMSNVEAGKYFVYQRFGEGSTATKYGGTIDVI